TFRRIPNPHGPYSGATRSCIRVFSLSSILLINASTTSSEKEYQKYCNLAAVLHPSSNEMEVSVSFAFTRPESFGAFHSEMKRTKNRAFKIFFFTNVCKAGVHTATIVSRYCPHRTMRSSSLSG